MKVKLFFLLLFAAGVSLWFVLPASATEDYWVKGCSVNQAALKNVYINEHGEQIYYNRDQKVLWELAEDFCVSLDLMVAYNFVLLPREPIQYTEIKIPPAQDKIGWIPGKSLNRPVNVPSNLASQFFFEETPRDQFAWPVRQEVGVVSQLYHNHHHGVDIGLETGTLVQAIGNGRVIRIDQNHHVYGHVIVIDHGNDLMAVYAHFSEVNVAVDEFVTKGQQIGLSGNTGRSSAPHLHFEIRESFRFTDPCDYYPNCPAEAFHGPHDYEIVDFLAEPAE